MKYSAKGFVLELEVATVFTPVAGVSRLDFPDADVQFYDGTSLDSDVSMEDGEPTGYVAPGQVSGELFVDPDDAVHQELLDLLSAPAKVDWQITNENIADFECAFTGTLKKCTPTAAVNDGFKANFEIKLAALAVYTYPAA